MVGDYVILESDVDKPLIDLQSQGVSTQNITRCSLLGKLMEDKLYAHHAEQDSLQVDSNQIYSYVDRTIDYFVEQLGSVEKVLAFYKKNDYNIEEVTNGIKINIKNEKPVIKKGKCLINEFDGNPSFK